MTVIDNEPPYASLKVVQDGRGYVLGSAYSREFVSVPEIGGQVVLWLQAGSSIEECTRRAAEMAGEPVDVAGFVDGLKAAGLLPAQAEAQEPIIPVEMAPWKNRLGRILYGQGSLALQGVLIGVAVGALIAVPHLRPTYADLIVTNVPLASFALLSIIATLAALLHEMAHVIAAWAAGVPSRISIGRRFVAIVYQTDLTRLWGVPRRARIVPLLAGMILDGAIAGVLLVLELTVLTDAPSLVVALVRAVILLKIAGIIWQFQIFLRTDVYALFVVLTGCKNLWDTKGAVARRLIRRATADDAELLNSVGRREIMWARVYLCLYVPGVLWAGWLFAALSVPALRTLTVMSWDAMSRNGLASLTGIAGATSLLISLASIGFLAWGLVRTAARLIRRIVVAA